MIAHIICIMFVQIAPYDQLQTMERLVEVPELTA